MTSLKAMVLGELLPSGLYLGARRKREVGNRGERRSTEGKISSKEIRREKKSGTEETAIFLSSSGRGGRFLKEASSQKKGRKGRPLNLGGPPKKLLL